MAAFLLPLFCAAQSFSAASPEPTDKTIPREIKIGKKTAEQVEKQFPRVLDPSSEAKLAMIAGRLTPYLKRELQYNVKILEMKDPNAFALPGGFTYITTGMLDFLKSDDEIAAILAHEFVHADRAHGIIQAARNNEAQPYHSGRNDRRDPGRRGRGRDAFKYDTDCHNGGVQHRT